MKKLIAFVLTLVLVLTLVACGNGNSNKRTTGTDKSASSSNYSSSSSSKQSSSYSSSKSSYNSSSSKSSYNSSSSKKSITHYCEASNCTREGTKQYEGYAGTEYYCETHYNELMKMLGKMESDVGSGSYSKHKCEECSKEGTHEIIGISGKKEYYCSEHYYKMKEMLEKLKQHERPVTMWQVFCVAFGWYGSKTSREEQAPPLQQTQQRICRVRRLSTYRLAEALCSYLPFPITDTPDILGTSYMPYPTEEFICFAFIRHLTERSREGRDPPLQEGSFAAHLYDIKRKVYGGSKPLPYKRRRRIIVGVGALDDPRQGRWIANRFC